MNISHTKSSTTCYKVPIRGHSNELNIKAILLQVLLMHFLLIGLFLRVLNSGCFYNMINYILELLAMLEI